MNTLTLRFLFRSMAGWTSLLKTHPTICKLLIGIIVYGTCDAIAEVTGLNEWFRKQNEEAARLEKEGDELLAKMCKEAAEQEFKKRFEEITKNLGD